MAVRSPWRRTEGARQRTTDCGRRTTEQKGYTHTEEGGRLDEAKIKMVTGGDKITARFLHKECFDFWPTHKLRVQGNYKPGNRVPPVPPRSRPGRASRGNLGKKPERREGVVPAPAGTTPTPLRTNPNSLCYLLGYFLACWGAAAPVWPVTLGFPWGAACPLWTGIHLAWLPSGLGMCSSSTPLR
jgi:hypothetical protein